MVFNMKLILSESDLVGSLRKYCFCMDLVICPIALLVYAYKFYCLVLYAEVLAYSSVPLSFNDG